MGEKNGNIGSGRKRRGCCSAGSEKKGFDVFVSDMGKKSNLIM